MRNQSNHFHIRRDGGQGQASVGAHAWSEAGLLVGIVWLVACLSLGGQAQDAPLSTAPNALTPEEKHLGFKLLFNGRDLEGWRHQGVWTVEDGALTWQRRGPGLVYKVRKIPDDFELKFEWKVASGSNSGVSCRPGQYEYQILDNQGNGDGQNPRTSAASLYFCMAPSRDVTHPVGQWNRGRMVYQGNVIQHWLNGVKVIDFDYTDPQWSFNLELLRQRAGNDLDGRGAYLSLQNHSSPVWYRSIKLRELDSDNLLDRTPVFPAKISPETLKAEQKKLQYFMNQRIQSQK